MSVIQTCLTINITSEPFQAVIFGEKTKLKKQKNGKIIAHYDSLEELVDDGWMLD